MDNVFLYLLGRAANTFATTTAVQDVSQDNDNLLPADVGADDENFDADACVFVFPTLEQDRSLQMVTDLVKTQRAQRQLEEQHNTMESRLEENQTPLPPFTPGDSTAIFKPALWHDHDPSPVLTNTPSLTEHGFASRNESILVQASRSNNKIISANQLYKFLFG